MLQQMWLESQPKLPQQDFGDVAQNGAVPVVQQVFPLEQVVLPHFVGFVTGAAGENRAAACALARLTPNVPPGTGRPTCLGA